MSKASFHSPRRRLQAKRILLTWAQCPIQKEEAIRQLEEKFENNIEYLLIAQEQHKDGNPHLHGVLLLKTRLDTYDFKIMELTDANGRKYKADVEVIRSIEKTIAYVKKENNWSEQGTNPMRAKKEERVNKLQFIKEHTVDEIIDTGNFTLFEMRAALSLKREFNNQKLSWPTWKKREVKWYFGETGTGKTKKAVSEMEKKYQESWGILSGDLRTFMLGYNGQRGIIIDDIRRGTVRFEQLLRLLDGYPVTVNIKGGQVQWMAETIIITCPMRPEALFADPETREPWDNIEQLLRRIDETKQFPEEQESTFLIAIPPEEHHEVPRLPESPSLSPIPPASEPLMPSPAI